MKKVNGNAMAVLVLAIFALSIPAASADLGGQRFPRVDWNDDNITNEEIAIAQSSFADPGTMPGSPLYFLKRWGEDFQLAFTFNETEKAKLHMERAKIRLAELKKLIEDNKTEHARSISDDFTVEMKKCRNYTWLYNDSIKKNAIVLGIVNQNAPPQSRDFIERTFNGTFDDDIREHMREGMRGREFGLPPMPPGFAGNSGKYEDNSGKDINDDEDDNSGSSDDDD